MKIVKKIVIRVIVAVLVCVILSKLKLLNIMEVSALEYYTKIPTNGTLFDYQYNGTNISPLTQISLNRSTFYAIPFQRSNGNYQSASFNFDIPDGLSGKYTTLEFASYQYIESNLFEPVNFYVKDYQGNISYCYVNSTSQQNSQTFTAIFAPNTATAYCPRVILRGGSFQIYLASPFNVPSGGTGYVGITALSFKVLTDEELILEEAKEQTKQQKETNDLIKDDSSISNDKITDITNIDTNTTNTPVSDFITLPITLLGKYRDGINGSCSPVSLGSMYGYNFVLPCISISSYIGNDLWHLIDMMISFFLVYKIAMMCLKMFEDLTSLKDPFDEAYSPKHADNGKHGEV